MSNELKLISQYIVVMTHNDHVSECRPGEMYELRQRLVTWFVLMHTESRQKHHKRHRMDKKKHFAEQLNLGKGDVFDEIDWKREHGKFGKKVEKRYLEIKGKVEGSKRTKRSASNMMKIETEYRKLYLDARRS